MTGTSTGPGDAIPPRPEDDEPAVVPQPRTAPADHTPDTTDSATPPPAPATRWQRFRAGGWGRAALWVGGVGTAAVTAWAATVGTGLGEWLFEDDPPATCPGTDCDGRNPQTAGCGDDAFAYVPQENNPVALQIRHSPDCNAVWGRITAGEKGDMVTTRVPDGPERLARISYSMDVFTRMTKVDNDAFEVSVCATPTTRADRDGGWDPYCIHADQDSPWH
ncbi:DUF2690 domain-containing protein [Streptomyces carpaticus]|uniref:DUF2690 domain-containing protein n=1 Tax=Streptomyces carpaticus TaxID=285558 RepID=A0ABV4ZRZ6_9ACTN